MTNNMDVQSFHCRDFRKTANFSSETAKFQMKKSEYEFLKEYTKAEQFLKRNNILDNSSDNLTFYVKKLQNKKKNN